MQKIALSLILAMFLTACGEKKEAEGSVETTAQNQEVVEKKVEVAQAKEPAQPKQKTAAVDASKLFAKCTSCHGQNGEKAALGKSQIIKGWSVEKVMDALHGYKEGTYGGAMKGVMKSQVANYSEDELKALASHISKL